MERPRWQWNKNNEALISNFNDYCFSCSINCECESDGGNDTDGRARAIMKLRENSEPVNFLRVRINGFPLPLRFTCVVTQIKNWWLLNRQERGGEFQRMCLLGLFYRVWWPEVSIFETSVFYAFFVWRHRSSLTFPQNVNFRQWFIKKSKDYHASENPSLIKLQQMKIQNIRNTLISNLDISPPPALQNNQRQLKNKLKQHQ